MVIAIAAAVVASFAFAAAKGVGKKTLGGRGWATNVTVAFTSPEGYSINGSGYENWLGPKFTNSVTGNEDESTLSFDVHSDYTTRSPERAARSKLGADMGGIPTKQVAAGPIDVPHVVGGRKVGVIKAFFLIRQVTKSHYEGWFEAGLAFSLGTGYPIPAADLDTTAPDDDATKTIQGKLPSEWNLQVIQQALHGIAVEGNLAPRKVTARVLAGKVTGQVVDTVGHPVVGVRVVLERRTGSSWTRAATGTTTGTGRYAVRLPKLPRSTALRVSAAVESAVARSPVTRSS